MYRYPSGFFAACLLLLLVVLFSSPANGQEIVISETMWNGLKLEYAQLVKANSNLHASLENSQLIVTDLNKNLATQWLQLNTARNSALSLKAKLETAQTQAALLGNQLAESENGLSELNKSIRRAKGKAYLIGGAVGLVAGIIAGVILGVNLGG